PAPSEKGAAVPPGLPSWAQHEGTTPHPRQTDSALLAEPSLRNRSKRLGPTATSRSHRREVTRTVALCPCPAALASGQLQCNRRAKGIAQHRQTWSGRCPGAVAPISRDTGTRW